MSFASSVHDERDVFRVFGAHEASERQRQQGDEREPCDEREQPLNERKIGERATEHPNEQRRHEQHGEHAGCEQLVVVAVTREAQGSAVRRSDQPPVPDEHDDGRRERAEEPRELGAPFQTVILRW
jgi:hypothetical protein